MSGICQIFKISGNYCFLFFKLSLTYELNPVKNPKPLSKNTEYWPVLIHSASSFLGQSLMQLVDLLYCRDLGSNASATVGTASTFFAWFMILGVAISSSLEHLIPHSLGAKEEKKAGEYFFAGIALTLIVTVFSIIAMNLLTRSGSFYGMNPEIATPVERFSQILALSFLPTFLIPLFRIELQSRGFSNDTTYAFIFGNLLNVFLNWALIYGHAGFPALGVLGSAYSTLLSRTGILVFLLFRLHASKQSSHPFPILSEVKWRLRLKTITRMGTPSAFHMLFEIGAFIFVSTLASRLSTAEAAAHAITLTIASFTFMLPAGMSSAAALTMSRKLGEGRPDESTLLGDRTLKLGLIYAVSGSLLLFGFRRELIGFFTLDERAFAVGTSLLLVAAIFQMGDVFQVILSGCIRGFGETVIQAKTNALGHWLVGIPVGLYLCFYQNLGIEGLWIGLCAGLFTVAAMLGWRYHTMTQAHRKKT